MAAPTDQTTPTPGEETRRRLVDSGLREFAERGVHAASLLDIGRRAGQRNRGAVHYHFGSREGLLVAIIEEQVALIADRERELLAAARTRADDDLPSVVEAFVRPAVELADQGWRGSCYLVILCQLVEDRPLSAHPDVVEALERAGGYEAYQLLEQRMPPMPDQVRAERMSLTTSFILRASADRARAAERTAATRSPLATEAFIANLVSMATAMLAAPVT
ncbi:TetR family transcriptional regulator [Nocardioides psychrotolerans]|uniref:TetR/AcrR family transcriptional regulator n=1 Tax=Nocardioides psychrotolerans TaxID=1005945 RepID=UPI0031382F94